MNDIGGVRLRTARPLIYDGYRTNRTTGAFILVEQGTNATVAAGMTRRGKYTLPMRLAYGPSSCASGERSRIGARCLLR